MRDHVNNYDVVIAGGGPAGTSAAIHLASNDVKVLLVEQKKFPRAKLCGEFISPECQAHFQRLGVSAAMAASHPAFLTKTVFYSRHGHHVAIPSGWFGYDAAMGLSRAVMDDNLLQRAKEVGVSVLENATITDLLEHNQQVSGVRFRSDGSVSEQRATLTIDATGRARALARKVKTQQELKRSKPKLVAFKAHLEQARVAAGVCEIYVYPGGYGGLSSIEGKVSNLCFIVSAEEVRRFHSDPETVLRQAVMKNRRAAYTLDGALVSSEWLSVSLESFGGLSPTPAPGLIAIGDSASFIDPFTGSGMLMALESGELLAKIFVRHKRKSKGCVSLRDFSLDYANAYRRRFGSRLRTSGLLRLAAFKPRLAETIIAACGTSKWLRNRLARATRSTHSWSKAG